MMKNSPRNMALMIPLLFAVMGAGCATHNTSLGTKIDDTAITSQSAEPRRIPVPVELPSQAREQFHNGHPHDALRGHVVPEDARVVESDAPSRIEL